MKKAIFLSEFEMELLLEAIHSSKATKESQEFARDYLKDKYDEKITMGGE